MNCNSATGSLATKHDAASRSRRAGFGSWVLVAVSLIFGAAGALPASAGALGGPQATRTTDPATGQELIVIPRDWQSQEPFAARYANVQALPPTAHVIDIAATRFVTDGLPKWAPGEHKLTASA